MSYAKDWIAKLRSAAAPLGSFFSFNSSTWSPEDACGSTLYSESPSSCTTEDGSGQTQDVPATPDSRRDAAAATNATRENELLAAQLRERDAEMARQERVIQELQQRLADEQLIRQLQQRLGAYQSTGSATVSAFSSGDEGSATSGGDNGSGSFSVGDSHVSDSYSNADLLEFGRRR